MGTRLVFVNRCYGAHGLTLASNFELPLPLSQATPDLQVSFEQFAQVPRHHGPLSMEEAPTESGFQWRVLAGEECVFTALLEARKLSVKFSSTLGHRAVIEAFLHPLLARVLRVLGVPALHASVVSWKGQGVAIVGESGAGKSTLAKALVDAGAEVVSDDLAVLQLQQGKWRIPSGSSSLRLFEAGNESKIFSLKKLTQPPMELKSESSPISKSRPVSFRLALFLEESSKEMKFLELEDPRQKLIHLLQNRFAPSLLSHSQKEEEFILLSQLAREVSMMKLVRPKDRDLLPEQVRLITQLLSRPAEKVESR